MDLKSFDIGPDPNQVNVGVGELAVGERPQVLITRALGSCVGLGLWDPRHHIGGMAHVMLPVAPEGAYTGREYRFADVAVPELVGRLVALGARERGLVAKLAGGAAMFHGESGLDSIGARNVAAVTELLHEHGIRIAAADTGGSHARTVALRLDSGVLVVRSYALGIHEI